MALVPVACFCQPGPSHCTFRPLYACIQLDDNGPRTNRVLLIWVSGGTASAACECDPPARNITVKSRYMWGRSENSRGAVGVSQDTLYYNHCFTVKLHSSLLAPHPSDRPISLYKAGRCRPCEMSASETLQFHPTQRTQKSYTYCPPLQSRISCCQLPFFRRASVDPRTKREYLARVSPTMVRAVDRKSTALVRTVDRITMSASWPW